MKKGILLFLLLLVIFSYPPSSVMAKPQNDKSEAQFSVPAETPLPAASVSASSNPTPLPSDTSEPSDTPYPAPGMISTPIPRSTPRPNFTPTPLVIPAVSPAPKNNSDKNPSSAVLGTENNPPPNDPPVDSITNKLVPIMQNIFQTKPKQKKVATIMPPALSRLASSPVNFYLNQGLNKEEDAALIVIGTILLGAGLYLARPSFIREWKNMFFKHRLFRSSITHRQLFG